MSLYEVLGIGKGASADEVKAAYRRRAQETHPDKGGSDEDFQMVNRAYVVLSDPTAREHYDATGEEPNQTQLDLHARARMSLASMLLGIVDGQDATTGNMRDTLRNQILEAIRINEQQIREFEERAARREKVALRWTERAGKENLMANFLEHDAKAQRANIPARRQNIEVAQEMLRLLEQYDYEMPAPPVAVALAGVFGPPGGIH